MKAFLGLLLSMVALVLTFANVAGIEDGPSSAKAKRYRYGLPLRYKTIFVKADSTSEEFFPLNLILNVALVAGSTFASYKLLESRDSDS